MIKVENIEVFNFEGAIRGMRNPFNSWDKGGSIKCYANPNCSGICRNNLCGVCIGKNDLALMKKLYKTGSEHRKYLRQIFVSMDITAPLYWWKELDQYKIGVTTDSTSTMHSIHKKEFTLADFSHEKLDWCKDIIPDHTNQNPYDIINYYIIGCLNSFREWYLESKDKKFWYAMIQLLPQSYNQKRTITMNYENVVNIIKQRSGHKLDEWNKFVKVLKELPYIREIMEA